ncbi:MAG: hypothetical protein AB7H90_03735 [Alphaproteobacteria bacterium]
MSVSPQSELVPIASSPPRSRIAIALLLYFLIPSWIGWFVHESVEGLIYKISEAIGTLLIPILIAGVIRIRSKQKSNAPFYIAIIIAALAFLSSNQKEISDASDFHRYRREMAGANSENFRQKLAHSTTRMGQFLNSALLSIDNSRLVSITSALEDVELNNLLASDTLLDKNKRNRLRELIADKIAFAGRASSQMKILYDELWENLEAKLKNDPTELKRSFQVGFDRSRPEGEKLTKSYIENYGSMYRHLLTMLDILDANDGKFTIQQDGKVIFANNAAVESYNRETAGLQGAAANIQNIQEKLRANQGAMIQSITSP